MAIRRGGDIIGGRSLVLKSNKVKEKTLNKRIVAILAIWIVLVAAAATVFIVTSEASPSNQAVPEIVFEEKCITNLKLTEAPNGLAGFTVEVDVEVTGTTPSEILISGTDFPLSSVTPIQTMRVSGVDLSGVIEAGAVDVSLFTISPCITTATIRALDDDLGNPILPAGTVVTP